MLLKDFYKITSLENIADSKYQAVIFINAEHDIFKGHFPGNPVTPGVCMMQIIKEITESVLNETLTMVRTSNVKFTAIINPEVNSKLVLEIEISENEAFEIKVKNTILQLQRYLKVLIIALLFRLFKAKVDSVFDLFNN